MHIHILRPTWDPTPLNLREEKEGRALPASATAAPAAASASPAAPATLEPGLEEAKQCYGISICQPKSSCKHTHIWFCMAAAMA